MTAMIALLRGINVGGNRMIRMEELRALCGSLKLCDATTYLQSGNVVFHSDTKDISGLGRRIEDAIERKMGFRPDVILRSASELKETIRKSPYAKRSGIEPNKLAVVFLASEPAADARAAALGIEAKPEELHIAGRELFVYYPNGMGRPKLTLVALEKVLRTRGTARNWNTVNKLLEIAQGLGG